MAKKQKGTEEQSSELQFKEKLTLNGKLLRALILLLCFGIMTAIWLIFQAQDLSDIDGYKSSSTPPRNIQQVLTKAVEGNYSVTLTEADINQMFQSELEAKQGGMFSSDASIKRVLVRLKDGLAEVIILREVFGVEMTVSMYIQIEQKELKDVITTQIHPHSGNYEKDSVLPDVGGRFGRLSVPGGFLRAVLPDYIKIADVLSEEIDLATEKMARIKIEDNRITLDPRRSTQPEGVDESTY